MTQRGREVDYRGLQMWREMVDAGKACIKKHLYEMPVRRMKRQAPNHRPEHVLALRDGGEMSERRYSGGQIDVCFVMMCAREVVSNLQWTELGFDFVQV
uniref:Uncharacterized protein n=1 Tax=Knipowitschia caucasica TaxID=637954 RepID=A0AAV2JQG1_KNICA